MHNSPARTRVPLTPHPILPRRAALGALGTALSLAAPAAMAQGQLARSAAEITIRAGAEGVTLINVFVVEPGNQDALLRLLVEGTETLFSQQPGYISSSFHKSDDGRRVVNYGQWRAAADIAAFRNKPEIAEYFKRIRALAQFEAIVGTPSYVHHV